MMNQIKIDGLPAYDKVFRADSGEHVRIRFRAKRLADHCEHCASRHSPATEFIAVCCTACLCESDGTVLHDAQGAPEWKIHYSLSAPIREFPGWDKMIALAQEKILPSIEGELKLRRAALQFDVEDLA